MKKCICFILQIFLVFALFAQTLKFSDKKFIHLRDDVSKIIQEKNYKTLDNQSWYDFFELDGLQVYFGKTDKKIYKFILTSPDYSISIGKSEIKCGELYDSKSNYGAYGVYLTENGVEFSFCNYTEKIPRLEYMVLVLEDGIIKKIYLVDETEFI